MEKKDKDAPVEIREQSTCNFVRNRAFNPSGGPDYLRCLAKYGVFDHDQRNVRTIRRVVYDGRLRRQQSQIIPVPDFSEIGEPELLLPVSIGNPPQVLRLELDTASADFWVFSTLMLETTAKYSAAPLRVLYNPAQSNSWHRPSHKWGGLSEPLSFRRKNLEWRIDYGQGSWVSGVVGFDDVEIGNTKISQQAVQLVKDFFGNQEGEADGVLGLAFGHLNTVIPEMIRTPLESMIDHGILPEQLFTIDLSGRDREPFVTFGFIDDVVRAGQEIHWVDVDSRGGFWNFPSKYVRVGKKVIRQPGGSAVADTTSRLILTDPEIVAMIYNKIEGAQYDRHHPGWVYPVGSRIPRIAFSVGDDDSCMVFINQDNMCHSEMGAGMAYGAIQENPAFETGNLQFSIFGTPFLKQIYGVFDVKGERLGVIKKDADESGVSIAGPVAMSSSMAFEGEFGLSDDGNSIRVESRGSSFSGFIKSIHSREGSIAGGEEVEPTPPPGKGNVTQDLISWFQYAPDTSNLDTNRADMYALRQLRTEAPSDLGRERAHQAALTYLRHKMIKGSEPDDMSAETFAALQWLYPDDSCLSLALAKAYLQNTDCEALGMGITTLKRLVTPGFINPEMERALIKEVLPYLEDISNPVLFKSPECGHLLQFYWKAPDVFRDCLPLCHDLPKFVVLTEVVPKREGKPNAQKGFMRADRVEDFVIEHWGLPGRTILNAFHSVLLKVINAPRDTHTERGEDNTFTLLGESTVLYVCAVCLPKEWEDLVRCLLWIDEVIGSPMKGLFRLRAFSPEYQHGREVRPWPLRGQLEELDRLIQLNDQWVKGEWTADDVLEKRGRQIYEYPLIQEMALETRDECWAHLFEQAYIGTYQLSFQSPIPNIGKGLRVSFDLMCVLSGIEQAISGEDGGRILTGYRTALVPVRVVNERDKSIQWHLIVYEGPAGNNFRSIHNRENFWESLPKERLRESSLENLRGVAFVGWSESVEIKLGRIADPPTLNYTELSPVPHRWVHNERGTAIGGQIGLPLGITILAEGQLTQVKVSTVLRFTPSAVFGLRIDDLSRYSVFIYDDERKTAWLSPQILLILHMLRVYIQQHQYDSTPLETITCSVHEVGGQIFNSTESIRNLEKIPVGGSTYGDIITKLGALYEEAFSHLTSVLGHNPHEPLLGFELNDLLNAGRTVWPKALPVENGIRSWSPLLERNDLVFCRGLGDVIVSTVADDHASRCALSPISGKNILVCPIYLLKQLLMCNGCQIRDNFTYFEKAGEGGYKWVLTGTPFKCCAEGRTVPCELAACWAQRLQRVVPAGRLQNRLPKKLNASLHRLSFRFHLSRKQTTGTDLPHNLNPRGAICFGEVEFD